MAIDSYVPNNTKLHMLRKAFPAGDTYKIALYSSDPSTSKYTSRGEVSGKGYTPGGLALEGYTCDLQGSTAYINFKSPKWENSSIEASYAMIYNSSDNGTVVVVLEFDETISKNATFYVEFPANGPSALLTL